METMTAALPISRYQEWRPPPVLAGHLVCLWRQTIAPCAGLYHHAVLPDGCADLVWLGAAPPLVVGPATRPITVPLPAGIQVLGARLRPGMAPSLLTGLPLAELQDQAVPLAEFWPGSAADLTGRILASGRIEAQLRRLAAGIGRKLADARPHDPAMLAAIAWLARRPGGRVEALGRSLGLSPRHFRRRFAAATGYQPKVFQRILRLQRLLALAATPDGRATPAALAAAAGYADQAHMSRELRALTNQPPSRLLQRPGSTLAMADLFKTEALLVD